MTRDVDAVRYVQVAFEPPRVHLPERRAGYDGDAAAFLVVAPHREPRHAVRARQAHDDVTAVDPSRVRSGHIVPYRLDSNHARALGITSSHRELRVGDDQVRAAR